MAVALDQIPLFHFLTPTQLEVVVKNLVKIEKQHGQAIVTKGDPVPGVYVVVEGRVGVYLGASKKPLAIIEQGGCFGEMSLLEGMNASATVRAEVDSTSLWILHRKFLEQQGERDQTFSRSVFQGMAKDLSAKLRSITTLVGSQKSEIADAGFGIEPASIIESIVSDLNLLGGEQGARLQELASQESDQLRLLVRRLGKASIELKKVHDYLTSLHAFVG